MARRRDDEGDDRAFSAAARAMREGDRPSVTIDFPGLAGVRVTLWCPNEEEETQADVESRQHLTKRLGLSALDLTLAQDTELARREREIELLAQVLRDPTNPEEPFFESPDELRRRTFGPQRKALIAAIDALRRERFEARTPEESAEIVRVVRDLKAVGALSMWWTSCDSASQLSIVLALVEASETPTPPSSSDT